VGNIKDNKRNELNILVLAIFLLMFTTSISWTISNVKSYSVWKKEMANYINKKIQPDSNTFIACHPGNLSLSILPYIYTRLMYLTDENRWGSYTIWNQKLVSGSFNPGIVRNVAELSEEHRGYKDYYYLTINELQQDSAKYYDIELLKKTNNPHPANNTSKWATIYLYRLPKYQHSRDR